MVMMLADRLHIDDEVVASWPETKFNRWQAYLSLEADDAAEKAAEARTNANALRQAKFVT